MTWSFLIITYLNLGVGLWSWGFVPSPPYASAAECELARHEVDLRPEPNMRIYIDRCFITTRWP